MGKSCCAIDCKNRFNKHSELSFYRLPKAKEKRSKWITAIRRSDWTPGGETWLCSCHFVTGKKSDDPLHPDYIPSLFSFTPTADRMRAVNNLQTYLRSKEVSENRNSSKGTATTMLLNLHQIKEEDETAFPVKEENETAFPVKEEDETAFPVKEEDQTAFPVKGEVEAAFSIGREVEPEFLIKAGDETVHPIRDELQPVQDTAAQTEERHHEIASLHDQVKSLSSECQSLRDTVHKLESELKRRTLDPSNFDDSKMKIFTGLPNLQTFTLAFSYTSSVVHVTEKQSLKPTQELLLTLMKLHNNLSEKFLGHLFGVHQSTVSRIFRRWIKAMASRLPDSEFPQLKAAISQHLLLPGPAEGADSAEKATSTPLQVLCVRTGQLSYPYSTLQTNTGQDNTRKLLSTPITGIKHMHSPSSSTAPSTFPSNAPPSLL